MKWSMAALVLSMTIVAGVAAADEPQDISLVSNGLYSTVTFPKRIGEPIVVGQGIVRLQGIPGFQFPMDVGALWQTDGQGGIRSAPLAVSLLGLNGRSDDKTARHWQTLLFEAGFHVMMLDSSFSNGFNAISGLGVAGNVAAEAEAVSKVIAAFFNSPEAKGKVTDVRLLGISYGGFVALYLAKLNGEGRLPFPLGPVVALSPPVSMRSTSEILDRFYDQDFGSYDYKVRKLVKLRDQRVVGAGEPIPFEPRLMRAGIGYGFHEGLKRVVRLNSEMYWPGLLARYKQAGDKRGSAAGWTYTGFVEDMSYPYWHARGAVDSVDEFWALGDLKTLLPGAGDNVFVYVSQNDPLDDPAEVRALQAEFTSPRFNVLSYGGHLGYAVGDWVKEVIVNRLGAQACSKDQHRACSAMGNASR